MRRDVFQCICMHLNMMKLLNSLIENTAFQAGDIAGAGEIFARLAPLDAPSAAYGRRCAETPAPLPLDWAGVWKLTGK